MPLDKSGLAKSVGTNYKAEIAAGKPKKQALAIALSEQRANSKGSRKAKLVEEYNKHMASAEEKTDTKKESKKAEQAEM